MFFMLVGYSMCPLRSLGLKGIPVSAMLRWQDSSNLPEEKRCILWDIWKTFKNL